MATTAASKKAKAVFWDKDKCAKPSCLCGKSSIEVLLDWLSVTDKDGRFVNYLRWKGGVKPKKKGAETKGNVASSIIRMLQDDHNLVRNQEAVLAKLTELHTSHNAARDFLEDTGRRVRDRLDAQYADKTDPAYIAQLAPVQAAALKLCKHYDTLAPIMADRPDARPDARNGSKNGSEDGSGDGNEDGSEDGSGDGEGNEQGVGDVVAQEDQRDAAAGDHIALANDSGGDELEQHEALSDDGSSSENARPPPRGQRKRSSSSDSNPAKRRTPVKSLVRQLDAQITAGDRTAKELVALRTSELAHKIQVREEEVRLRRDAHKLNVRTQRHAEIMAIADLRRQLGLPAQDILDYVDSATRALDAS